MSAQISDRCCHESLPLWVANVVCHHNRRKGFISDYASCAPAGDFSTYTLHFGQWVTSIAISRVCGSVDDCLTNTLQVFRIRSRTPESNPTNALKTVFTK